MKLLKSYKRQQPFKYENNRLTTDFVFRAVGSLRCRIQSIAFDTAKSILTF